MTAEPSAEPLTGAGGNPAVRAGWADAPPRKGFFTDTSVCIGCKACEVACKEWNTLAEDGLDFTGMSYDNTGRLSADTWRHVAFIEQKAPTQPAVDLGMPSVGAPSAGASGGGAPAGGAPAVGAPAFAAPAVPEQKAEGAAGASQIRWLMSSDVCKHCTDAACLDVCPTGALFRTEFGTVVVQQDVCNGCGYCVSACPYGVIEQRRDDGRAFKCTMCYDRLTDGQTPACAKACPTESIQFGDLDELRERAAARVEKLHDAGLSEARLYGHDPHDGVGGDGAFFLLLDEPEVYGLPPDPVVTTRDLPSMWKHAAMAALGLLAAGAASFLGGRR
jgi:formate dehydrogenase iron-sulfur subunit